MSNALLIIDIQNDYFPGGRMELVGSVAASLQAKALLEAFRARGLPVIHVQHLSNRPGATFFLPDTEGARIHGSVEPAAGETVITKHFPNAFRETTLAQTLGERGIKSLVIAGMMSHMCIDTSTRAAADAGYACTLVHDACATRDLAFGGTTVPAAQVHAAFMAAMNGAFAKVVSASEAIAALG